MHRLLLLPCLAFLLAAAAPASALAAPVVTTNSASDVGQNTATVQGTVDPMGVDTGFRFQFGPTASYGTQTADAQLPAFAGPTEVSETLAGLAENTTFHYRVLAWPLSAPSEIVYGRDRTFHTVALPTVSTGSPRNTQPTGTTFVGKVDPNGSETTWYFEWGRTQSYGNRTAERNAGSGRSAVTVASTLSRLAPNTTYHVRMVATNAAGIKRGRDRGFRTLRQPTGIVIASPTARVRYGGVTTIDGKVQGAGVNGIRVALESSPFPFTAPFARVGDTVAAARDGSFRLVTPPLFVSTRLHVVTRTTPAVTSPQITALSTLLVRAKAARVNRRRYRIQGTVTPDVKGARVSVQRRSGRKWVSVRRTRTSRIGGRVGYRVLIKRARKARRYRVLVTPQKAAYERSTSNSVKVPRIERARR
jgi:hypothetical protein